MSLVFISHSSHDSHRATELKTFLESHGHRSTFLDFDPQNGIPAGADWERELYAQLRACRAVIVLCSEHAMSSHWCFAEVAQARALGKIILPVRLDDAPVFDLLQGTQAVDFRRNDQESYQRIWRGLLNAGLDPTLWSDWDGSRPPYPGLLSFQERDAAVYFGRDGEIRDGISLLNRLHRFGGQRLVVLVGPSGTGKSSLLRAGILPRLRRGATEWIILDPLRPLGDPFAGLADTLSRLEPSAGPALEVPQLLAELRRDDGARFLQRTLLRISGNASADNRKFLLPIDQFEEIFAPGLEDAERFLHFIGTALRVCDGMLICICTLRSDFLGAFQEHRALREIPVESILVGQMPTSGFAQIIEGPAGIAGIELGPGLVQAMVEDTGTPDALPLLAYTLQELWLQFGQDGRLDVHEYRDRLGGLEGSVARAAEAVLKAHITEMGHGQISLSAEGGARANLSADDEKHLRAAILSMVRLNEDAQYVRQPARWSDLPAGIHPLLRRFVECRLLVSDAGSVEVAHEALLRSWKRAHQWIDEDREFVMWRSRLRFDVERWRRSGSDESVLYRGSILLRSEPYIGGYRQMLNQAELDFLQESLALRERELARSRRVKRITIGLSSAALVLIIVAAVTAFLQQRLATSRALSATAQLQLGRDPQLSLLLATEAARLSPDEQAVEALRLALVAAPPARLAMDLHTGIVWDAALSRDGNLAATAGCDRVARVWDAREGEMLTTLVGHSNWIRRVRFDPGGSLLVTAGGDGTARVWDVRSGKELHVLTGHRGPVWDASFDQTGKRLITAGADGTARVWDVSTGRSLNLLDRHRGWVRSAGFSSGNHYIGTASTDGTARLWDGETGAEKAVLSGHTRWVNSIRFNADATLAVTASDDSTARVWSTATGSPVSVLRGHEDIVRDGVFSPDGAYVATVSDDGMLILWDPRSGARISRLGSRESGYVTSVAFSPDSRYVVSGGYPRIWSVPNGRLLAKLEGVQTGYGSDIGVPVPANPLVRIRSTLSSVLEGVSMELVCEDESARKWEQATSTGPAGDIFGMYGANSVLFSSDGRRVLTGGGPIGDAAIWEVRETLGASELGGHEGPVRMANFGPTDAVLVTAGMDGKAIVWDRVTGDTMRVLRDHASGVTSVRFNRGADLIVTAGYDGTARVWDAASATRVSLLQERKPWLNDAVFDPRGELIVTSMGWWSSNGSVEALYTDTTAWRVWNARSGRVVAQLRGHGGAVTCAAFDPGGRWLATGSWDKTVRIWDVTNWREKAVLQLDGYVKLAIFDPGRGRSHLLATADSRNVKLWDVRTGRLVRPIVDSEAEHISFSPVGRRLAVVPRFKSFVEVWDGETGRKLFTLRGHRAEVTSVAFSPDGDVVATSSDDGTVRVWSAATGEALARIRDHSSRVEHVAFSPDGHLLVSTGSDGRVKVHQPEQFLPERELLQLARKRVEREFTEADRYRLLYGIE